MAAWSVSYSTPSPPIARGIYYTFRQRQGARIETSAFLLLVVLLACHRNPAEGPEGHPETQMCPRRENKWKTDWTNGQEGTPVESFVRFNDFFEGFQSGKSYFTMWNIRLI